MEQAITTGLEINDPFGWNIEFGRELRFWRFVLPRVGNHRWGGTCAHISYHPDYFRRGRSCAANRPRKCAGSNSRNHEAWPSWSRSSSWVDAWSSLWLAQSQCQGRGRQEGSPSPLRLIALDDTRRRTRPRRSGSLLLSGPRSTFNVSMSSVGSNGHFLGQWLRQRCLLSDCTVVVALLSCPWKNCVECITPTIIASKRLNIENSLKRRKAPPTRKSF